MKEKVINIPCLGDCTLLHLAMLPANKSSYKNLLANAQLMGLKEVPTQFTENNLKAIIDSVANFIGSEDTLWISGTVRSMSIYNKAYTLWSKEDLPEEDCIVGLDFNVVVPGVITSSLFTVGIEEYFVPEHTYCLFFGKLD